MPPAQSTNYVPAVAPQERRQNEGWREPPHTAAAINENIMAGVGAGMVVAAVCVLILPAWYFWPLPAWVWGALSMLAAALSVGGFFNLARFGLDEWRGWRWVSAAQKTMLEQEQEIAVLRAQVAAEQKQYAQLEQENSWLQYRIQKAEGGPNYTTRQDATVPGLRADARALVDYWVRTGLYPSRERIMSADSGAQMTKARWEAASYELRSAGIGSDGGPPDREDALHKLSVRWSIAPSVPSVRPDGTRVDGRTDDE